jgi:hypothetical protein
MRTPVDKDVLARLSPADRGRACICQQCGRSAPAEEASADMISKS